MARSSYHHGNLRQALVEATVRLIEDSGPQGFTLAEAARLAGVSAAAPYRHFTGRDELLEEVARQGFEEFADRLGAAFDDARPQPLTAFLRMGQEYLVFAAERRGFYIAMFESGISITGNSALQQASERARSVLVRGAESLFVARPGPRPPAGMIADHIWALSHGVVELFGRGKPGARSPISPADMLESGALIYLRGLGVIPD